jgi:MFS family permease
MLFFPTSSALAANFAPADMRGRYMAVSSLVWSIPGTIGPAAAGYIIDNYNPNLVWYIGGLICIISGIGYYALHLKLGGQKRFAPLLLEKIEEVTT